MDTYKSPQIVPVGQVGMPFDGREGCEMTGGRPFEPILAEKYLEPLPETFFEDESSQNEVVFGGPLPDSNGPISLEDHKLSQKGREHLRSVLAVVKHSFELLQLDDPLVDVLSLSIAEGTGSWKK